MILTEHGIKLTKKAAEKISEYGKITLTIKDGKLIDIVTENRERVNENESK